MAKEGTVEGLDFNKRLMKDLRIIYLEVAVNQMDELGMEEPIRELNKLWCNEWDEQEWLCAFYNFKHLPNLVRKYAEWDEWVEVTYWEQPYHPINALFEVSRTLRKIESGFFKNYMQFRNQERYLREIILKSRSVE